MKCCSECNNPLERDDAAFCTECGAKVVNDHVTSDSSVPSGETEVEMNSKFPAVSSDKGPDTTGPHQEESAAIKTPNPPTTTRDEMELPFTLAFNQSVFLIEGCDGVLECRVIAKPGQFLEDIAVTLQSDALGEFAADTVSKLAAGRERLVGLSIKPKAVGKHHLCVTVVYEQNDRIYCVQAFHGVTVLEKNASSATIQIHYENRIVASDNAVVSSRAGNLTGLERMIASGQAKTNDLLSQDTAASWLILDLEIDEQQTRELQRQHRQVVRPLHYHDATTDSLDRVSLWQNDQGDEPALAAQILSRLPLAMGRAQQSADLVLRVLPRSADHDEQSKRISGSRHVILQMENGAPELHDPGSANGVWLDNQRLDVPCELNTRGPSRIDIAHVLSLQLTPILGGDESQRYARLNGQDELWRWAQSHSISGYKIEFIEGQEATSVRPPVYFPMRWIDLIDDARLGLTLSDQPGRAPVARIVRTQDGLWIEACKAGLTINAQSLDRAKAIPLEPNTTLCFNHQTIRFGEFVQFLG